MVNKKIWLGIPVMVLVFGMIVVGCDNGITNGNGNSNGIGDGTDPALNGTWVQNIVFGTIVNIETVYNNGNFEVFMNGQPLGKGTYTTNDNRYKRTVTHAGKGRFSNLESSKVGAMITVFLSKSFKSSPERRDSFVSV